jgi:type IV secretion system protein VirD4
MRLVIAVLLLVLFGACVIKALHWAFIPRRVLPGHRVRYLRLRLRLRLHPGRGHATAFELWLRWGRLACLRRSGRSRRSMSLRRRLAAGSLAWSLLIGRAHYRHGLRIPLEEHALIMAPPRTGKTGWLARVILHYPGPVVSTTTKADVFELTSGVRSRRGPVHVFNPQSISGVPSTFHWNPLAGCQDPAVAIRRADGFAQAVAMGDVEDASFWTSKASDYLRAMFCAAALANWDMRAVADWVLGNNATEAENILRACGHNQWATQLAELRGDAQKTAATVRMTMSRALAFMTDPALAASVVPGGPGVAGRIGLDIENFLRQSGTLYLIAESSGDDAPLAPLFACLAGEIHHTAALLGSHSPGGRLDPPLLMALDEIVQVCPVPLPAWLADSGGKGIQIFPVVHGEAQLRTRWKMHGAQVVMDTCGVKLWLPGITDPGTLEMASKLCGKAAFKERGQEHDSRHEVMTPEMIRQLLSGFALVIRGGLSPVVARLPVAWKDRTYKRARRAGAAVADLAAAAREPVLLPPDAQEPQASLPAQAGPAGDAPAPEAAGADGQQFPWTRTAR